MKFNVLVVAAMVITSVNAKWGASQEPDPNETGPTCDDLEAKLLDLYDNISARNSRVCYGAPELYKILEGDMGRMVGNGKDGAETEVAQKSDENEVQESTYMRVEEWFRLYFKYKTELDNLDKILLIG
ncbi:hypothetical protein BASA61_007839 [Batrachochytrium salamandrivorans]|nr:hypothetical protein BASA61_007839 [Batrachochytrium salamandrivorans]